MKVLDILKTNNSSLCMLTYLNFRIHFLTLVLIPLICFLSCSSPQVDESITRQQTTLERDELQLVTKKNWQEVPTCCRLNSISLDVVVLEKICVSKFETVLSLHTTESKKVCVLKEGMIFRDNTGKEYKFLSVDGVGICPKRTQMKQKTFSIKFDPLEPGANSIDLIEDKNAKYAHRPWSFEAIDLRSCQWM